MGTFTVAPEPGVVPDLVPAMNPDALLVVVPSSRFNPDPKIADVVTLDPPPYHGPVKRVIAVLS